jgi:endonuclease/exonuclease/phosphatase family metal-dependent hydrolase
MYAKRTSALMLASINIERSRHLARVIAFLSNVGADVVCLQELVEEDLHEICDRLDFPLHAYVPMMRHPGEGRLRLTGVGILARVELRQTETVHYAGNGSGYDPFDISTADSKVRTSRYSVALAEVLVGAAAFTIGCTHFPWTPDGSASDHQRRACDRLCELLADRQLVLCGDFNAPRGGEIFSRLASHWRDNVPTRYLTSIDPKLHRDAPLERMVDGVFSTSGYRVGNVVMHEGVSDHCALTAEISSS